MKIMVRLGFKCLTVVLGVLLCSWHLLHDTQAISLSFTQKILEKKKYITVEGEVYYKKQGGVLTTRLVKPFENVTIINANGEMKNYDVKENTLMLSSSALTSSESSYFWYFLNGSYNDLGLPRLGYVIMGTRTEHGVLVTTWVPKEGFNSGIAKIELVHEKSLPIYMEFTGPKNKRLGKIFFSSYQKVGGLSLPLKITEIAYKEKNDSVVTYKAYSNPKINKEVNLNYLEFKIPANAKLLSGK
jgi:outer membrane lipoprotein-sorting protein